MSVSPSRPLRCCELQSSPRHGSSAATPASAAAAMHIGLSQLRCELTFQCAVLESVLPPPPSPSMAAIWAKYVSLLEVRR